MIKRILALRYVCKKYDLKYCWTFLGDVGWINTDTHRFSVSLFQKHFYDVLYHEVGHLVADRSLKFRAKHDYALQSARLKFIDSDHDLFVRLQEEATACKFAFRVLKNKDRDFLRRCWYTYTGKVAKFINGDELEGFISTIHKYNKYFEGNTK